MLVNNKTAFVKIYAIKSKKKKKNKILECIVL